MTRKPRRPYTTRYRNREAAFVNSSTVLPLVTQEHRAVQRFFKDPPRPFPVVMHMPPLSITTSRGTTIFDARLTSENAPEVLTLVNQFERTGVEPKHFRKVRAPLPPTPPQMAGGGPPTSPLPQPSTRNAKE